MRFRLIIKAITSTINNLISNMEGFISQMYEAYVLWMMKTYTAELTMEYLFTEYNGNNNIYDILGQLIFRRL